MVLAYRFHSSNTGQHSLASAAKAAEEMINNGTSQNNQVSIANMLIEPYRSAMLCFAEILKVVLHMTVTVIHFQTFGNILAAAKQHIYGK